MAKRRHTEPSPTSSRTAIVIMAVGGLLVAGLLVWALTRTVEPIAPAVADVPLQTAPGGNPTPAVAPAPGTPEAAPKTPAPVQPAPPQTATTGSIDGSALGEAVEAVPRISAEDLRAKMNRGDAVVVDVRDAASYATAHIPGAVSMPFASVETMMSSLPRGKEIVTYCT